MERLRQEKTKYLSVIGSVVGAGLGIIGTSINYGFKRRDFNKMLQLIETHNSELSRTAQDMPTSGQSPQGQEVVRPVQLDTSTQTTQLKEETIVETILNTESNLEYKMKVNSLATVVLTYALIAVTLPLILKAFGQ